MINKEQRPDLDMEQVQIRSQPKYHELIAPQWSKRGARPYCYQAEAEEAAGRCRSDHNVHSRPSVDSNPPLRARTKRGSTAPRLHGRDGSPDGTRRRHTPMAEQRSRRNQHQAETSTRRDIGGSVAANGESWRARGGEYIKPPPMLILESRKPKPERQCCDMGVGLGR
jgi:hypothetical protein